MMSTVPTLTEEQLDELLDIVGAFIVKNGPKGILSTFDIEISLQPKLTEEELCEQSFKGTRENKMNFALAAGNRVRGGCYPGIPQSELCDDGQKWIRP